MAMKGSLFLEAEEILYLKSMSEIKGFVSAVVEITR